MRRIGIAAVAFYKGIDLVEQKEVGLALLVGIQQVYRLHTFFQVAYYIIVEVGLQHIFNRGTVLLFYVNNVTKNGRMVIPVGVVMQKLHRIGVAFHAVNETFKQVELILLLVEFAVFLNQLATELLHFALSGQNLLFGLLMLLAELLQKLLLISFVGFPLFFFAFYFLYFSFPLLLLILQLHDAALQVGNRSIGHSHLLFSIKLLTLQALE